MNEIKVEPWKNALARVKYTLKTTETYPLTLHNGLQLEHKMAHPFPVRCITYASAKTGQQYISHLGSGFNTQINIWTIANAGFTKKFQRIKIKSTITNLAYVPKHRVFVGFCQDLYLRVFSNVFDELSTSLCPTTVLSIYYNEPTDEIFTGGVGFISIWKFGNKINDPLEPGRIIQTTVTPEQWVTSFHPYPNSEKLLALSGDGIYVLDYYHNEQVNFFRNWHDLSLTSCVIYRPLEYIITGAKDGSIKVWNLMVYSLIHTFLGHLQGVTGLLVHPHEPLLLSSSTDHTLRTWRLDTFEETHQINVGDAILGMKFLNNHQLFYHSKENIKVWNLNHFHSMFAVMHSNVLRISRISAPDRAARIMVVAEDGGVRILSPVTSNIITTLFPLVNNEVIEDVAYDLTFNYLFAVLKDGDVLVFDGRTNPCTAIQLWKHSSKDDIVTAVTVLHTDNAVEVEYLEGDKVPSLSLLFAGHYNGQISLLHGTGSTMENVQAHAGVVVRLVVSYGNDNCTGIGRYNRLVSLGSDRTVRIWRVNIIPPEAVYLTSLRSIMLEGTPTNVSMMGNTLCFSMKDCSIVMCQLHETKAGDYLHGIYGSPAQRNTQNELDRRLKNRTISVDTLRSVGSEANVDNRPVTSMTTKTIDTIEENEYLETSQSPTRDHPLTVITQASSNWSSSAQFKAITNDVSSYFHHQDEEHTDEIIGISCCPALQLFVTSAKDGSVKVWDTENALVREMVFDDSLRGVSFVNDRGDILIGYQKHISIIPVHNYLSVQYLEKFINMDIKNDVIEQPATFNTDAQFWYKKESVPTLPIPFDMRNFEYPQYDLRAIRTVEMTSKKKEKFHPTLLSRLYLGLQNTEFSNEEDLERGEKAIRIFLKYGVLMKKRLKDRLHQLANKARTNISLRGNQKPKQITELLSNQTKEKGESQKNLSAVVEGEEVVDEQAKDEESTGYVYQDEPEEAEDGKLDAIADNIITEIATNVFDENFRLIYADGYVPNSVARKLLIDFMPDLVSLPDSYDDETSVKLKSKLTDVAPEDEDDDTVFVWTDSSSEKESAKSAPAPKMIDISPRQRTFTFDSPSKKLRKAYKKRTKEQSAADDIFKTDEMVKRKPRKVMKIKFQKKPLPPPHKKSFKTAKENLAELASATDTSLQDVIRRLAKLAFMPRGISETKDSILKVFLMMIDHCTTAVHQEICAGIVAINKFNGLDQQDIETVVEKLTEQLNHPLSQIRLNATQTLSTLGIKNKNIMIALLPRLVDNQSSIREEAKALLERMGINSREGLIKLMEEVGALKTIEQVDEEELITDIAERQMKSEGQESGELMAAWFDGILPGDEDLIAEVPDSKEVPSEDDDMLQENQERSSQGTDSNELASYEREIVDEEMVNLDESVEVESGTLGDEFEMKDEENVGDEDREKEAAKRERLRKRKERIVGATRARYNRLVHRPSRINLVDSDDELELEDLRKNEHLKSHDEFNEGSEDRLTEEEGDAGDRADLSDKKQKSKHKHRSRRKSRHHKQNDEDSMGRRNSVVSLGSELDREVNDAEYRGDSQDSEKKRHDHERRHHRRRKHKKRVEQADTPEVTKEDKSNESTNADKDEMFGEDFTAVALAEDVEENEGNDDDQISKEKIAASKLRKAIRWEKIRKKIRKEKTRGRKQTIEVVSTVEMENFRPKSIVTDDEEEELQLIAEQSAEEDVFKTEDDTSDSKEYVRKDTYVKRRKKKKSDIRLPLINRRRSETFHPILSTTKSNEEEQINGKKLMTKRKGEIEAAQDHSDQQSLPSLTKDDSGRKSDSSLTTSKASSRINQSYKYPMETDDSQGIYQPQSKPVRASGSEKSMSLKSKKIQRQDTKSLLISAKGKTSSESSLKDEKIDNKVYEKEPEHRRLKSANARYRTRVDEYNESTNQSQEDFSNAAPSSSRAAELLKSMDEEIAAIKQYLQEESLEIRNYPAIQTKKRLTRRKRDYSKKGAILPAFNAGLAFLQGIKEQIETKSEGRTCVSAPTTVTEMKPEPRSRLKYYVDYTKLFADRFIYEDRMKLATTPVTNVGSDIKLKMAKGSKGQRLIQTLTVESVDNEIQTYDHLKDLKEDQKYLIEALPYKLGIDTPSRKNGEIRFGIMNMLWTTDVPALSKLEEDTHLQLDENAAQLTTHGGHRKKFNHPIQRRKHNHDILLQQMRLPSSLSVVNRSASAPVTEMDMNKALLQNQTTISLMTQLLQSNDYLLLQQGNDSPSKLGKRTNKQSGETNNRDNKITRNIIVNKTVGERSLNNNRKDGSPLKKSTMLTTSKDQDIKSNGDNKLSAVTILPSIVS